MNKFIKQQLTTEKLLNEVFLYYTQSTEFNGMPLSSVVSCPQENTKVVILKLIEKGDICILSSKFDINPNIIRFGFPSKKEQTEYVQNYSLNEELFLYPSPNYLEKTINVSKFVQYPFKLKMSTGYPQLKACFFEYSVLQHYAFDPRMNLKFPQIRNL